MKRQSKTETDVRELLSSPYYIARNIRLKDEQIARLRALAIKTTGSYTAERVSGTAAHSKVETYVTEIVMLTDEIEKDKAELAQRILTVRRYIAGVRDWRTRNVMEAYHLNGKRIWEIANEYGCSERWIKRMLQDGRREIARKMESGG